MIPFIGQGEQEETQVWIMGGGDHIYIYICMQIHALRVDVDIHVCGKLPI